MKNLFALSVLMVGISGCASAIETDAASPEITIEILEYGTVKGSLRKPNGKYTNPRIIKKTDRIFLKRHRIFGLLFRIKGPYGKEIKVERVFLFPTGGLTHPENGIIYEKRAEKIGRVGSTHYTGYRFDYEWEMVPGKWAIQFWYENKKLAEQVFIVYE